MSLEEKDSAAAAQPAVTRAESESSSHCGNLPGLRGGYKGRGEPSRDVPCLGVRGCWHRGGRNKVMLCPGDGTQAEASARGNSSHPLSTGRFFAAVPT